MLNKREDVERAVELGFMSGLTVCLMGASGIGKTQMAERLAEKMGRRCITLNAALQQSDTLSGYPYRDGDRERFAAPAWFPCKEEAVKTMIFIDELNRASRDVLNALMPMLLTGRLSEDHCLPDDTPILCAVNPATEEYEGANDFQDASFWDRLCVIPFEPLAQEWIQYEKERSGAAGCLAKAAAAEMEQRQKHFSVEKNGTYRSFSSANDVIRAAVRKNVQQAEYFSLKVTAAVIEGLVGSRFVAENMEAIEADLLQESGSLPLLTLLEKPVTVGTVLILEKRIAAELRAGALHREKECKAFEKWILDHADAYADVCWRLMKLLEEQENIDGDPAWDRFVIKATRKLTRYLQGPGREVV